jgi:membrane-associated phospholipid phosphatase
VRRALEKRPRRVALWWFALLFGLLVSTVIRGKMDNAGFPVYGAGAEEQLFGTLPSLWLQAHVYDAAPRLFEWAVVATHISWFIVPYLFVALVSFRRPERVGSLVCWFLGVFLLAQPFFALFPLEPPWLATNDVLRINSLYLGGEIQDANPLAAMPSLHVALPVTLGLWFFRERWAVPGYLALAYGALISFEVVLSGEHYVIDVVGGVAAALAVALLARRETHAALLEIGPSIRRFLMGTEDMAPSARAARRERAQALIEFAFIAPIMFVFLFGIVDFAIAVDRRLALQHGVREGARFGAVHNAGNVATTIADIEDKTEDQSQGLVDSAPPPDDEIIVCYVDEGDANTTPGNAGDTVRVQANFEWEFPIFSEIFQAFGGGPLTITMDPSATARLEQTVNGATACP